MLCNQSSLFLWLCLKVDKIIYWYGSCIKLIGLKWHSLLSYSSRAHKSDISIAGLKSRCQESLHSFRKAVGENPLLTFLRFWKPLPALPVVPPLSEPVFGSWGTICTWCRISPSVSCLPLPPSLFWDFCNFTGHNRTFPNYLPSHHA